MGKSKSTSKNSIKGHIGTKKYQDLCGRLYRFARQSILDSHCRDFIYIHSASLTPIQRLGWLAASGCRRLPLDVQSRLHSHGTFLRQYVYLYAFFSSIYPFPLTLLIFLLQIEGRSSRDPLIYQLIFSPPSRIICLKPN